MFSSGIDPFCRRAALHTTLSNTVQVHKQTMLGFVSYETSESDRLILYCSGFSKAHTQSGLQNFQVLNGGVIFQPLILRNVLSDRKLCKNSVGGFFLWFLGPS